MASRFTSARSPQTFRVDSDRFAATFAKGDNRLVVQVGSTKEPVEFHLRFRRKSATAEHERSRKRRLHAAATWSAAGSCY